MATTMHHGAWTSLSKGYGFLGQWIHANGYEITGIAREIFHHIAPGGKEVETVTEIQFPIKRVSPA